MRARDVIGHRIVRVSQTRRWDDTIGQMVVSLEAFELDNGALVLFTANDDGIDNYVTGRTVK